MSVQIQPSVVDTAWEAWQKNTAKHEVEIVHNDGLHRHLRFAEPGTRMWSMSVVTWPGFLATSGDIGSGFVFSRTSDMLEFFYTSPSKRREESGAPSIDFRYWAEKIQGRGIRGVDEYSERDFLLHVKDFLNDEVECGEISPEEALRVLEEAAGRADNETSARSFLDDKETIFGTDTWEWSFTEPDFQFVLACYSIWHIAQVWNDLKEQS